MALLRDYSDCHLVPWKYRGSAMEVPWKCHGNVVEARYRSLACSALSHARVRVEVRVSRVTTAGTGICITAMTNNHKPDEIANDDADAMLREIGRARMES